MTTPDQVREALRGVNDPELQRSIVDLGMVRSIDVAPHGRVDVTVALTTPGCPIRSHFQKAVSKSVSRLGGVSRVNVAFDVLSRDEKHGLERASAQNGDANGAESAQAGGTPLPMAEPGGTGRPIAQPGGTPLPTVPGPATPGPPPAQPAPQASTPSALARVKNVVCIGSGKGGVGKSTITANLTAALAAEGKQAAALDADVWGYSIPRMLGVHGRPTVSADRKIVPLLAHGGMKAISIEFFLEEPDQAIVWRGPMLHKAIRQFLEDVEWGDLDYLLIDLPPGTGDVSMTLAQLLPQAAFLIVTTPQPAAQKVAKRASDTARKFDLEITGVIENMSGFTAPSGERLTIFGEGGGQLLADELDVPLLGKVPLQEELRVGADEGRPLVLDEPDAPASQAIFHAARGLIAARP